MQHNPQHHFLVDIVEAMVFQTHLTVKMREKNNMVHLYLVGPREGRMTLCTNLVGTNDGPGYRKVNARVKRSTYYCRKATDVLAQCSGSIFFSFVDAVTGFNQIENTRRAMESPGHRGPIRQVSASVLDVRTHQWAG